MHIECRGFLATHNRVWRKCLIQAFQKARKRFSMPPTLQMLFHGRFIIGSCAIFCITWNSVSLMIYFQSKLTNNANDFSISFLKRRNLSWRIWDDKLWISNPTFVFSRWRHKSISKILVRLTNSFEIILPFGRIT